MASQPDFAVVAEIVAPFGIKGEVKANVLTDFPDRLAGRKSVYLQAKDEKPRLVKLRGIRFHQGQALLTLEGCADRNAAEALRGTLVQIPARDMAPLPDGAYYLHQIIGLEVVGLDGEAWGRISSVLQTPSNDVYVVDGERGQFLLPAVPDFVQSVDIEHGRIVADMARI
jgi:16S rRNA processing protein RimM